VLELHVWVRPGVALVDWEADQAPEEEVPERSLISIVDDDQPLRESMRRLLRSFDYAVEAFPSAAEFLASPCLDATACLIADVHMPGMKGDELYRCLVDAGKAIPTILVTAYPDEVLRDRVLKEGVVYYLHKPIDKHRLVACIRSTLTRPRT
jgi:FixJ family two-component response regulator